MSEDDPSSDNVDRPAIPLAVLRKLIHTLSAEQLAALPLDKLPAELPAGLIEEAPPAVREVLADILVQKEAHQLSQHVREIDAYGQEVADALHQADVGRPPVGVRQLQSRLIDLAGSIKRWRDSAALSGATESADALGPLVEQMLVIDRAVQSLRRDISRLFRAEHVLRSKARKAGADRVRVTDAILRLKEKATPYLNMLGQYHSLRLTIAHLEMRFLYRRIKAEAAAREEIDAGLAILRESLLEQEQLWQRALDRFRRSAEFHRLQSAIAKAIAAKRDCEVPVPEQDLLKWLDVVVDAALDPASEAMSRNLIHAARLLLYRLLSHYCRQQEGSARDIARNPFVQIDAQQAIDFLLRSEQFILAYFARKREQSPYWFTGAVAVHRERLDQLAVELIEELQANIGDGDRRRA